MTSDLIRGWIPVRRKTNAIKRKRAKSDSIETGFALMSDRVRPLDDPLGPLKG